MPAPNPQPHQEPRILRIWEATPAPTSGPSLEWTLSRFYREYVEPHVRRQPAPNRRPASPKTIEQDKVAIGHWVRLTGDPPLAEICDAMLAEFVVRLMSEPAGRGRKPAQNTARKVCLHLGLILSQAAAPTKRNPRALGLYQPCQAWPLGLPTMPTPPAEEPDYNDFYSPAELGRLFEAAQFAADSPRCLGDLPGRVFWPALLTVVYNTGLRIDTVMSAERTMIGLNAPDFLTVPPEICKGGRRLPPICVNRYARAALEALAAPGLTRLLPWQSRSRSGRVRPWPAGRSWLFEQLRGLIARAGIPPHRDLGFDGLRKALFTWVQIENPGLAPIVKGQRGSVLTKHYTHFSAVRELMNRVPQPGKLAQRQLF